MVAPEVGVRLHTEVLVERLQLEPQVSTHPVRLGSPHWIWDKPRSFCSGEAEMTGFWT